MNRVHKRQLTGKTPVKPVVDGSIIGKHSSTIVVFKFTHTGDVTEEKFVEHAF